jgi:signal transduction histidine kinase
MLAVAGTGSFTGDHESRVDAFLVLLALVAVPWATVLLFISESHGRQSALTRTAWIGDLVLILLLDVLVPGQQRTALLLSLSAVAISGYVVRSVPGWVIATTAISLTAVGELAVEGRDRLPISELAIYAAVVVAVTLLMSRVGGQQRWAAAHAAQLEGRAGTILNAVPSAIVLTNAVGEVHELNPAARTMVANAPPGAHGCMELLQLHDGERALDCRSGCALLAMEGAQEGVRLWRPRLDGTRQPLLASATLVGGAMSRPEIVHALRDITRLMHAEEAKTLFLATTSHELKTPITVIRGFADSLLRRPDMDPEIVRTALDAISRRSVELAKIVDRLLMSSRIEAGQLSLELESVDIAPIIEERVRVLGAAAARPVALQVQPVPAVVANADALATVVDHLVDNAFKYAPGEAPVTVGVAPLDETAVVVRVADQGVGMDAEQREHCFDKFWQAETGSARRFGGSGIGLYIVRSLVEAMGGTITVRSELGVGTEFTVTLPLQRREVSLPVPRPGDGAGEGEPSMIREFMRQIGIESGASR